MIRKALEILLITLIQIIGLTIIHDVLYYLYPISGSEIGFKLTNYFTKIIFIVLFFAYNFCSEFYRKNIYLLAIIFVLITSIFPLYAISYRPFRSLLLIVLIIFGFVSSIIIFKRRAKNKL